MLPERTATRSPVTSPFAVHPVAPITCRYASCRLRHPTTVTTTSASLLSEKMPDPMSWKPHCGWRARRWSTIQEWQEDAPSSHSWISSIASLCDLPSSAASGALFFPLFPLPPLLLSLPPPLRPPSPSAATPSWTSSSASSAAFRRTVSWSRDSSLCTPSRCCRPLSSRSVCAASHTTLAFSRSPWLQPTPTLPCSRASRGCASGAYRASTCLQVRALKRSMHLRTKGDVAIHTTHPSDSSTLTMKEERAFASCCSELRRDIAIMMCISTMSCTSGRAGGALDEGRPRRADDGVGDAQPDPRHVQARRAHVKRNPVRLQSGHHLTLLEGEEGEDEVAQALGGCGVDLVRVVEDGGEASGGGRFERKGWVAEGDDRAALEAMPVEEMVPVRRRRRVKVDGGDRPTPVGKGLHVAHHRLHVDVHHSAQDQPSLLRVPEPRDDLLVLDGSPPADRSLRTPPPRES